MNNTSIFPFLEYEYFNPLKNKKEQLINVFVKFYGEQNREKITKKINNTTFVFVNKHHSSNYRAGNNVDAYIEDKLMELYKNFCVKSGYAFSKQFVKFNPDSLSVVLTNLNNGEVITQDILNLNNYFNFIDVSKLKKQEKIEKINTVVSNPILLKRFKEQIESVSAKWNEQFSNRFSEIKKEKKLIESVVGIEQANQLKIAKKYDTLKKDILINHFLDIKQKLNLPDNEFVKRASLGAENFVLEDILIKNPHFVTKWDKDNRVKFFKNLGLGQSDNYEHYLELPQVKGLFENSEVVKNLQENLYNFNLEKANKSTYFKHAVNVLNNTDLGSSKYSLIASLYTHMFYDLDAVAYVQHYLPKNSAELKTICVLPFYSDVITETVTHEINHIIETEILEKTEDKLIIKTGFEIVPCNLDSDYNSFEEIVFDNVMHNSDRSVKRETELLNEVFNDYVACVIAGEMKRDGIEIGKETSMPIASTYSLGLDLVQGFIDKNMETVKKCKISNDPKMLAKLIGENNFNELNNIVSTVIKLKQENKQALCQEISKARKHPTYEFPNISRIDSLEFNWSPDMLKIFELYNKANLVTKNAQNILNKNKIKNLLLNNNKLVKDSNAQVEQQMANVCGKK